jgi:VWFA-related protein
MRSKLLLLMFLALLLPYTYGGCSGGSGSSSSTPDIETSESSMEFGNAVIDNFADRTLTITNTGQGLLSIGQIAQANPLAPPFEIVVDNCSGRTGRHNDSCTLKIRFSPSSQAAYSDSFDIPSNDLDEKSITVNVFGDGKALKVAINQVITDDCPDQIRLIATVTDKDGDAVTGLTADKFYLFENDIEQMITDVRQVQPPLSIVLALDSSYSVYIGGWIPQTKTAAKGFVDQMNASDEASVIKFGEDIEEETVGFISDKDLLKAAIEEPYDITKIDTLLYDTVWLAVDNVAAQTNERKAVLIISDGRDFGPSAKTLTDVIDRALEKGIPVFTIGMGEVNSDILQQLADETGGQYYFAPQSSDLEAIYIQIANALSNQYVIEYDSSSSGSGIIILDLEVEVSGQQGEDSKESQGC